MDEDDVHGTVKLVCVQASNQDLLERWRGMSSVVIVDGVMRRSLLFPDNFAAA